MKSREYQITLTDGNRTGIATLRLDGQCVEWLTDGLECGRVITRAMESLTGAVASIAHVRDIPDESEGDQ